MNDRLLRARVVVAAAALGVTLLAGSAPAGGSAGLAQVRQEFTTDPGWEGVNNRMVGEGCPTVTQEFGWEPGPRAAGRAASKEGRIGGMIWQSRTPAYYALPLKRELSYDDPFSFSCRVVFPPPSGPDPPRAQNNGGSAYLGFFNSERQGYRPWSSVAIRFGGNGQTVRAFLAYMSADWGAAGHDLNLHGRSWPADGASHLLRVSYDPDATVPAAWPDAELKRWVMEVAGPGGKRVSTQEILDRARQSEPGLTEERLQPRLTAAVAEGLLRYAKVGHQGRDQDTWDMEAETSRGAITVVLGDRKVRTFVSKEHRGQRLRLNRFGLFNHQVYHQFLRLYFSDLTVNGKKIDLSRDPVARGGWEAKGNRATYVERDFQRQDFGYSPGTAYAGGRKGEIGGLFSRTAYDDPNHGYYADDVGRLTLDDPLSISGKIGFPAGNTDAGMFMGYFNAAEKMKPLADADQGRVFKGGLGINVEGTSSRGYDFAALVSPVGAPAGQQYGTNFVPRKKPYSFTLDYDPKGGKGFGQIRFSLENGPVHTLDLTQEQRAAGATFDRFGLSSRRVGGTYVEIYFDDLTYTARRADGAPPVRHKQTVTVVPFPRGGRER